MLNDAKWLGTRILERPSCAFWRNALWIAHLDLNQEVTVSRVDVGSVAAPITSVGLGITSPYGPALTTHLDALVLAVADPSNPVRILTSTDGSTFTNATPVTFTSITPVALAAASSLWLAWVDDDRELHIASGSAFSLADSATGIMVSGPPALAAHDDLVGQGLVSVAWQDNARAVTAAISSEKQFDLNLSDRITLDDKDVTNVSLAFAPGHAGDSAKVIVAFEREVPPAASSWDTKLFAREFDHASGKLGGLQVMPKPSMGPGLARAPGRIWSCWRDMADHADELVVAPYDAVFDLPPELLDLLGKPCDPMHCPPDPRLVCAAAGRKEWIFEQAWIRNALKGDLVITPASGSGIIGGFLKVLRFEQDYDHMGIVIEDYRTVRHATMAHARTKHFYGGELFGKPAPLEGIRPDALKYGWPGTITQSVQNGFFDGLNDFNPEWKDPTAQPPGPEPGPNANDDDREKYHAARARHLGFVDPEAKDKHGNKAGFIFANLTWKPQLRADGRVVNPIVVKPPPDIEANDPMVRLSLYRVAEAAKTIRGHYRFYAYTQGAIARNPVMNGPPKGAPYWKDLPTGADWAAGSAAVVCSTFVWAAVQEANKKRLPQLWLEDASEPGVEEQWRSQKNVIIDGLYRYHADERRKAGQALYDHVVNEVRQEVWASLMEAKSKFGWLVTVVKIGLSTLVGLLTGGLNAIMTFLGISYSNAQDLALALTDMPDDIGNQLCNTFAADRPDEKDEAFWEQPGEGVSVAPHDIIHLWDAPKSGNSRSRFGLWGHHERLIMPEPKWEYREVHEFQRSKGMAAVEGFVRYRGNIVVGALVRIGCESTRTDQRGRYRMEVAAAKREIVAGAYWPQSEWWLEGRKVAELAPGNNLDQDIDLEDPPEWRRVLQVRIKSDYVHQVLFGTDDWGHETFLDEHRFVLHPESWGNPPNWVPSLVWDQYWTDKGAYVTPYAGEERVRVKFRATIKPDTLAIDVEIVAEMIEDYDPEDHDADVEVSSSVTVTVPIDATEARKISLKTAELPPDRAWIEITLVNMREMA